MDKFIKSNFLVISDYNWLTDNIEESWVHKYSDNYLIYDRAENCHRNLNSVFDNKIELELVDQIKELKKFGV